MPTFSADHLTETLESIYIGVGVPSDEAATVTRHQIMANLSGHDSHGVMRTRSYVELIQQGRVKPGAEMEVVAEFPASLVIDGHDGFGFVITEQAQALAMEKAANTGVAALSVRHQGHIGRLGAYTAAAADRGMAAMLMADSGRGPKTVAPYGGSDRRLGSNPISVALPAAVEGNVVLDMATSAVAGGKIKVARSQGAPLGEGWAVASDGSPTLDPEEFFAGGAMLPFGGAQAYKGYGLSFVIESLAAVLSGIGFGFDEAGFPNDGILMVLLDVSKFRDLEAFKEEMAAFTRYVKDSPPAPGFDEVLYPGELEVQNQRRRTIEGIDLPSVIWNDLEDLYDRFKG